MKAIKFPCCLLWLLPALLTACGFQLRSEASLPPEMAVTRIAMADRSGVFYRQLERALSRSGIQLTADPAKATAVLDIPTNQVRRDILSIGDNARVREFRVRHLLHFQLLDAAGRSLAPMQRLEQYRDISFDETEILAISREEEFVRQELAQTMVRLLLQRLSRLSISPPAQE